ncbi:MAG: hypothetical protein ABIO05_00350 [Ferruginibacter sp.]
MNTKQILQAGLIAALILIGGNVIAQQIDSIALNNVIGKKRTVTGSVYKTGFTRSDLKVKVGDFSISPGLAFGK